MKSLLDSLARLALAIGWLMSGWLLAQERPAEFGLNYHPEALPAYLGTLPPTLGNPFLVPVRLTDTHAFASATLLKPAVGLVPYEVNSELWSDGAIKSRWMHIPGQARFSAQDEWAFPSGTVFVKHFDLVTNEVTGAKRRLETRLLVRDNTASGVYGVTYKWNSGETDAFLVGAAGLDEAIRITTAQGVRTQIWHYPSRTQCLECHNAGAQGVLGVKTSQLNREVFYEETGIRDNQLRVLSSLGLIDTNLTASTPFGPLDLLPTLSSLNDLRATRTDRLRSYLEANCAPCHRAGGPSPVFDARYRVPFHEQGIANVLLRFRDEADSRLLERVVATNGGSINPMPPLGRNVPHAQFIAFLKDYVHNTFNPDYAAVEGDGSSVTVHFNRPGAEGYLDNAGGYEIPNHTVLGVFYFAQSRDAVTLTVTPPITANTYLRVKALSDGQLPDDHTWNDIELPLRPGVVLNDSFASAFDLGRELFAYAPPVTNSHATAETSDPRVNGRIAQRTVWFKWMAPDSRLMAVDTEGSTGQVLLGVYRGQAPDRLSLVGADANPGDGLSRVQFSSQAGTTYLLMLGSASDLPSGSYHARITPVNDRFADAVPVGASGQVANWANRGFGKESGEPNHADNPGGASSWFVYESPCACGIDVRTYESDFDTLLAVYRGTALNNLELVAANDDVNAMEVTSEVFFKARRGERFYVAVDGKNGERGSANLFFEPYPGPTVQFVLPSVGEYVYAGIPTRLKARVSRNFNAGVPVRYFVDGALVGSDSNGTNGVSWTPPGPGRYQLSVEAEDSSYGIASDTRTLTALARNQRPVNDSVEQALVLTGMNPTVRGTNSLASTQETEPYHSGNRGGHSVWYRWTVPNVAGNLYFRVSSTEFDPMVAVYDSQVRLFAQNDDARPGELEANAQFIAFPGETYLIAVEGYNGGTGAFELEIRYVNANDDFANAWVVPGAGISAYVNNTGATAQSGEPSVFGSPAHTLWWSWTAPDNRPWLITTEGSDIATVLAVYSGDSLGTLSRIAEAHSFSPGGDASRVVVFPTPGVRYAISVDGYLAAQGDLTLKVVPVGAPRLGNLMVYRDAEAPLAFFDSYGYEGLKGVLEATTDFRIWSPVWTNFFGGFESSAPFSDYTITNPPARRFYRARYAP